jgi:RimJ/RimL family protein N-acetyltransferase
MVDPILRNFPDSIETQRLTIRCHRAGDGPKLFDALVESLDELRQYPASFGWALADHSPETCERFARECRSNFIARRDLPFVLFARGTESVVGSSGLHRIDWAVPKFEVGYWGRSSQRGRGLITEGVAAIVAFAFSVLSARRVEALPDDANARSWRLCERLGFTLEGTLRHNRIDPDGTLRNTRVYSKVP